MYTVQQPVDTRPVPIPHFTTDTDIRYLLSISDTGFPKNRYLIHSRYFIIVADIHYFQFSTQYNIILSNDVTFLVTYDRSQITKRYVSKKSGAKSASNKNSS